MACDLIADAVTAGSGHWATAEDLRANGYKPAFLLPFEETGITHGEVTGVIAHHSSAVEALANEDLPHVKESLRERTLLCCSPALLVKQRLVLPIALDIQAVLGDEAKRCRVDAVPKTAGSGSIWEDVPEVGVRVLAPHLGA